MSQGIVKKAMSSFYEVLIDGRTVTCRPRGRFRLESQEVLTGDRVQVRLLYDGTGYIEEIKERKNSLIRPPVANIDQVIIVFTVRDPEFNPELVDRVMVHAGCIGCAVKLVLNKIDLCTREEIESVRQVYRPSGCDFFAVSALTGEGIDLLRQSLGHKVSVLAGQSGVGKSRLLNAIVPHARQKVGDVSHRIRRGRHTTRHVELIEIDDQGLIADTPGFSLLEPPEVGLWELSSLFPEIAAIQHKCKFTDCLHREEPGCAVKEAVAQGQVPRSRYENYLVMLKEIEETERHKYS